MISNSRRNVIAILGICEGVGISIHSELYASSPPKTVINLLQKLKEACQNAHTAFPGTLDRSQLESIASRLRTIDQTHLKQGGVTTSLSICLGLLSDALDHIKDPQRESALLDVHHWTFRLFRYFDKKWNRWEAYATATQALKLWETTQ